MSSYVYIDKKKDILILGEGPTQGLDDTILTREAKYPINFTQSRKRFVLSLHYNGSNNFLFANTKKVYRFKVKDSEITYYSCVSLIFQKILQLITWKKWKQKTKTKMELKEVVKFFNVDFNLK